MGLEPATAEVDTEALAARIEGIKQHLQEGVTRLLSSQGVRMVRGSARFLNAYEVEVSGVDGTERIAFDNALIATGSRPRIPDWCSPDGDRILTTRDCYPPKVFPESVTVIGSGVTGVEFVHMFSSFGAEVTLVVSRQQVLPGKDPEVAAVLEADFLGRGVRLLDGRPGHGDRAGRRRRGRALRRRPGGPLVARRAGDRIGAQQRRPRPRRRGHRDRRRWLHPDRPQLRHQRAPTSTRPATSAASCRSRRSPRCRVARSPSG